MSRRRPDPRQVALRALVRVDRDGAFVDKVLPTLLKRVPLSARDRAFVTALVRGTVQWQGQLDWILEQAMPYRVADLDVWVRNILRMGLYQLRHMDRVPAYAAISTSVSLAKRHRRYEASALVNAVLRRLAREEVPFPDPDQDPVGYLAVTYSYPRWLVERWIRTFGFEEAEALCRAQNQPLPVTVRVNPRKGDREALRARLAREGVESRPARWSPDVLLLEGPVDPTALRAYREGWFVLQGEGAALVVPVLGPAPGEVVADLCAAPGGKTTQIAAAVGEAGRVYAVELYAERLETLMRQARRLDLLNIAPIQGDATEVVIPEKVDAVLVDVPCSATGVLLERSDARWRRRPEQIPELAQLQRRLLGRAAHLVKVGGRIVYSTCTLEPEENEGVVTAFLEAHPEFERRPVLPLHPELADEEGYLRILPHRHGIDGAFAALLVKVREG